MKNLIAKIKLFFDDLTKSLTDFSFYKEILKTKLSFSLKYLFFLFYILALITSVVLAAQVGIKILPAVPAFISAVETKAPNFYPKNLVVTVKNGEVSTNVKEPYVIDIPGINLDKNYAHLITIDTKSDGSNFKDYSTFSLVTKNSVLVADTSNTFKVYQIEKGANTQIDKTKYSQTLSKLISYLPYLKSIIIAVIIILLVIWPFIAGGLTFLVELIYLLVFSLLFLLVVKLMKKDLNLKKIFQLSIHASSLPILLGFIVSSLGIVMPPLIGTAILFIFMLLVINQF